MVGKWHLGETGYAQVCAGLTNFTECSAALTRTGRKTRITRACPRAVPNARITSPANFTQPTVFGDYALQFLEAGPHNSVHPWFMYLAFNAPHFPLHAPEAVTQKYETLYKTKGWDAIRVDRLARQKKLGLVPADLELPPREAVPANFINKQTGWADKVAPAWDTLPPDRQADLARRMAVYAAAVDVMDQNIGRVTAHLKKTGEWDNTLIFFLSDNGACAEWDPFGFDQLDSPKNILHTGEALKEVGGPNSYISYGSGWANACDTPWRLYKHYAHEGGIRTPLIAHWPKGLQTKPGSLTNQPGYLPDFMPTLVEVCGAKYPDKRNGTAILPPEGESLTPTFHSKPLKPRALFMEHEGNRMVRDGDWKLVAQSGKPWELYRLSHDPAETKNLAAQEPARAQKMASAWTSWAVRCKVIRTSPKTAEPQTAQTLPTPQIANRPLTIHCDVLPNEENRSGVLLAQGGNQQGYALHLDAGKPVFSVRENGKLTTIAAAQATKGKFTLEARLQKDGTMTLAVNGTITARGKAFGLIPVQPKDGLTIGEDTLSAVGNYAPPHPFHGKVENIRVETPESD